MSRVTGLNEPKEESCPKAQVHDSLRDWENVRELVKVVSRCSHQSTGSADTMVPREKAGTT